MLQSSLRAGPVHWPSMQASYIRERPYKEINRQRKLQLDTQYSDCAVFVMN